MRILLITVVLLFAGIGIVYANKVKNKRKVKFGPLVLALSGSVAEVGANALDFKALDLKEKEVRLSDFAGKIVVITSFPSINTPVCSIQVQSFNRRAASLGDDVVIVAISRDEIKDLDKFCSAKEIKNMVVLSDLKNGEYGEKYGTYIAVKSILCRGTVIVDKKGKIAYAEYVPEITDEPNYEATFKVLEQLHADQGFVLKKLPYLANALEPNISQETIDYHYGKHLNGYVNNLNKLLENSELKGKTLEEIIKVSEGAIFNNAGQVYNHQLYFETFSPNPQKEPKGELKKSIDKKWGSFDKFKEELKKSALANFGSGWTWLAVDKNDDLVIVNTSNADSPLTKGMLPLLTIDVWEHGYYIDYRNNRAAHIDALYNIINWKVIEERYDGWK